MPLFREKEVDIEAAGAQLLDCASRILEFGALTAVKVQAWHGRRVNECRAKINSIGARRGRALLAMALHDEQQGRHDARKEEGEN